MQEDATFSEAQEDLLTQTARTSQIIAVALMIGVFVFGAVIVLGGLATDEPPATPVISLVSCVFAAGAVIAAPLVSRLVAAAIRKTVVEGKQTINRQFITRQQQYGDFGLFVGSFQTKQIIGRAILEGAAFMSLIAYMLEAQPMSLAIAVFLLLAMLLGFPTRDRLEAFVREELSAIEQLRNLES